jgi:predicted membrane channel-forming protein YqfA (hemolysin III family)
MNTADASGEVRGRPPTQSEEDWIKFGFEERRSSITFLNDTAKLFMTLPSTLSTLYLALVAGISLAASKALNFFSISPIIFWIAAFILAGLALFPRLYKVSPDSPSDIEDENRRSVKYKLRLLQTGGVIFLLGIAFAAWRIVVLVNTRT